MALKHQHSHETLYQLAHDLARAPDLARIVEIVFAQGRDLLAAEYGFLMLADSTGSELRGVAAYGFGANDFQQEVIRVYEELTLAGVVLRERQPIILTQASVSPLISERLRTKYHFVKSSWVTPLMSGARTIGILAFCHAVSRDATAEEVRLLQLFGDEAALAIERTRSEEELRLSEERHRYMFDKNRAVKLLIDPASGAILDANPAAADFYGYPRAQLQQMRITDLNTLPPEHVAVEMASAVAEQRSSFLFQHRLASGDIRDVEVYSSPFVLRGQQMLYSIIHDVTERRRAEQALQHAQQQLEQRVSERTAELHWTISELQLLARVAAHDLQEPVRISANCVQLLAERYREKLGVEAEDFFQYAVDGLKRLQRLLLDFLAYSEASARQLEWRSVEGDTLLAGALADLRSSIADRNATVTHDPLPTVWGDSSQLQLVFRNLISNGVKFCGAAPPVVHVAASRQGEVWRFSIRDNGIGIEPHEAERIFLIFQRRQVTEPYPKPGVGLAICKKIIERHGGRIWVESRPGRGSTFSFTLPVNAPARVLRGL